MTYKEVWKKQRKEQEKCDLESKRENEKKDDVDGAEIL